MRNISFAMTEPQILQQSKDVTRRFGWKFLRVGNVLQPVRKSQGLKAGEKVVRLGEPIIVVALRLEPLNAITAADVIREGFPDFTPEQFVAMLVKHYGVKESDEVNRIEFDYLLPTGCCRNPRCYSCWQLLADKEKIYMRGYNDEWYSCNFDAPFAKEMREDPHWPVLHDACYKKMKGEGVA